jgi:hypothetical protein
MSIQYKLLGLVLAASAVSVPAFACQVSQAHIKGTISGNDIKNKVCYINVELEEVKQAPHCGLSGLTVGQEVLLRTELSERQCPDDEGSVEGTVLRVGGEFVFRGKLDKRGE